MNALSGWINTLGWTLLHFVWQGLLVGALYALAGLALARQRASVRYAVGIATLVLLAALPVATFWYLAPGAGPAALDPVRAVLAPEFSVGGTSPAAWVENWLPALVGFWVLGVAAFGTRYVVEYRRLTHLVREAAVPLQEWNDRLRVLCAKYGITRTVRLLQSAAIETPCLIGWIAPVIVLPASTLIGLTPAQVELVIAHELAHVRRLDYLVNALQIALETVLFYHPVVHWVSRNVRHDREACCDDLVLAQGADPVVYARALANLEELRDVPAPALAATGGFLLGRIRRIVGLDPVFAVPRTVPLGVLVLLLAAAALISQRQLSQPMPALTLADAPVALLRALHPSKPALVAAPVALGERARLSLPELVAPSAPETEARTEANAPPAAAARLAFAPARPERPEALRDSSIGDLAVAPRRSLSALQTDLPASRSPCIASRPCSRSAPASPASRAA
jgi:beta-lactamase regulating signal transducer with metallopeptidase domain